MRVTANVLLNYIRCRRYASLNDPNSAYLSQEYEIDSKKYFQKFLKIFLENYVSVYSDTEKNYTLSYEFHTGITLYEKYHFKITSFGKTDLFCLIPNSSKNFINLKYSCDNHKYQMFKKNKGGIYELREERIEVQNSNYKDKIRKLTKRTEDIGRITYNYAFKRYLYDIVNPVNDTKIYFVFLNSDYVYDGKNYNKQLFHIFDFDGLYPEFSNVIEADIYRMINHIELNDFTPCNLVNKECRKGLDFECKFIDFCFSHLPKVNSILSYFSSSGGFDEPTENGDIHHDTYDLINNGLVDFTDIPISWLKDEKHLMQRYCIETDYLFIHKEKVETILKSLTYPLIYLDLESAPRVLPKYKGEKPFIESVFQYSIHIEKTENVLDIDGNNHFEFIANPDFDNRKELVQTLISLTERYDSSIIVYNKNYVQQRLKELQINYPEYKNDLSKINDQLFDLQAVLRNKKHFYKQRGFSEYESNRYNFYSPILSGSYSLRNVIKVFNPNAYKDLKIKDKISAYETYLKLEKLEPIERDVLIKNLLDYCKQETYSMYEIIQGLKLHLSSGFTIT